MGMATTTAENSELQARLIQEGDIASKLVHNIAGIINMEK